MLFSLVKLLVSRGSAGIGKASDVTVDPMRLCAFIACISTPIKAQPRSFRAK